MRPRRLPRPIRRAATAQLARVNRRLLTRQEHASRDAMRRYGRRGVARCVLEQTGNEAYFETHPIADEARRTLSRKRLNYLARERTPQTGTGMALVTMDTDARHPKAATWP